jgi:hypothetical protein
MKSFITIAWRMPPIILNGCKNIMECRINLFQSNQNDEQDTNLTILHC